MSQTIGFIVTRAYSIAKIKKANIPVEDDEMAIGIDTYNDLIVQLAIDGVNLGATITTNKDDDAEVPDWALEMVKTQVALRLSDEFGRTATLVLVERADIAMRAVLRMTGGVGRSTPSSITPRGSGNTGYNNTVRFYPNTECGSIKTGANDNLLTDDGQQLKDNTGCAGINGDSGF